MYKVELQTHSTTNSILRKYVTRETRKFPPYLLCTYTKCAYLVLIICNMHNFNKTRYLNVNIIPTHFAIKLTYLPTYFKSVLLS